MRDPKRISNLLARLEKVWVAYPDLRLGQLISNTAKDEFTLFYIEDEELIEKMEGMVK